MTGTGHFRRCVAALTALPLVACGGSTREDPSAHQDVTSADASVRLVVESDANLVLHITNQSTDDQEVRLTIRVDDVTVVDGDFATVDQHNFVTFPLAMSSGLHVIDAESDSGGTLRESFEIGDDQKSYALLERWTGPGQPELTWQIQTEQMVFG